MWFRNMWEAWLKAYSTSPVGAWKSICRLAVGFAKLQTCGRMWLCCASLLCFQSTVCRTKWVYHTCGWTKSLQESIPTAEAASHSGCTQLLVCQISLCDCPTFWSVSPNQCCFATQTGKHNWESEKSLLAEIPAVFRFPGSTGFSSANIHSLSDAHANHFFRIFPLYLFMHGLRCTEPSMSAAIWFPKFPWIDS